MFKGVIIFGAGIYTGVYMAQNYQIGNVEHPSALVEKAQNLVKSNVKSMSDDKK